MSLRRKPNNKSMSGITLTVMAWAMLLFVTFFQLGNIPIAQASSPNIVISQVYGGGGNSGAVYTNDFIEIFNRSTTAVDVTGWSVQYASSAGTSWTTTTLSGTIQAGKYYLIQEAAGTGGTTALPTPDASGTIAMSGTSGKVALVKNAISVVCVPSTGTPNCLADADIVDFVGYGTAANNFEGAGTTANLSNTNSAQRAGAGCIDTDRNNLDFTIAAASPNARNSSTAANLCALGNVLFLNNPTPSILTLGAGPGAVVSNVANFNITNSDTVNPQNYSIAFTGIAGLAVSDGGVFTTISPLTGSVPAGATVLVSVRVNAPAANGTGSVIVTNTSNGADPINTVPSGTYGVNLTVVNSLTAIYNIQGAARTSPIAAGTTVATTGTVTGVKDDGFFMQDPTGDGSDLTSDGIFVQTRSKVTFALGTNVEVVGEVRENFSNTALGALSVRDLGSTSVIIPIRISTDPAVTASATVRKTPAVIYDSTLCSSYTPTACGLDFYEALEDMVVEVDNAAVVAPTSQFGEFSIIPDSGVGATGLSSRKSIVISPPNDFNPEWVLVSNGIVTTGQQYVGDKTSNPIVGPLDFTFSNFKIQPTTALPTFDTTSRANTESITALTNPGYLRVASYNIENFDLGDGARRDVIASHIANNLKSPDILVITEVQDDNGPTDNGVVSADNNLNDLVTRITTAGGANYSYRYINPVNDQDGGEPGGNIRQIFLFRTDRGVAFVDKAGGGSTVSNTVLGDGSLQFSPGRLSPTDTAFNASRKPLAGEFTFQGQALIVIGNHLNSKGGDTRLYGTTQPPVLSSEAQRVSQTTIIRNFVTQILTNNPAAHVIVAGDLNDYEFSNPLKILKNNNGTLTGNQVLTDVIENPAVANEKYTYIFEGNAQVLDHLLYSQPMVAKLVNADIVHLNADKPAGDSNRATDHEAVTAVFDLVNDPPTITPPTNPITTVVQNSPTFTVTLSGSDDFGQYTWSATAGTGISSVTVASGQGTASVVYSVTVTTGFTGTATFTATLTDGVNPAVNQAVNVAISSAPKGSINLLPASFRLATTQNNAKPKLTSNGANPVAGNSSTAQITAWGQGNIPTTATGIVGVLTNIECTGGANFRFWTGATVPLAANLNIPGANPALNLSTGFTAPLDNQGKFYLGIGSGATTTCGYVLDVLGYLSAPGSGSSINLLDSTFRLATTQNNAKPKLTSTGANPTATDSSTTQITAWGQGNIPTTATGIVGVLTNIECTGGANFRFWTGATVPLAANLNVPGAFSALNLSTNFIAPLDNQGKVYLGLGSGATTSCGYVLDVVGYIAPGGAGADVSLLNSSVRVVTTQGNASPKLTSNGANPSTGNPSTLQITIGGTNSIPSDAKGVVGVLTNIECTGGANFRFWTGATVPLASNLNVPGANPALNLSTGFVAPLGADGKVYLGLGSGIPNTCGYVVDVIAYIK